METISKRMDEIVAAKKTMIAGQLTLWNARLESLAEAGDTKAAIDALANPLADDINNCTCNVQCGALSDSISSSAVVNRG